MNIRAAQPGDLAQIRALVNAARLPSDDLSERSLGLFLVLEHGQVLQGVVGLERYGEAALLRSLVVADEARGRGYGRQLTTAAEALAQKSGVVTLYLLTTSAEAFFQGRGFRAINRDEPPSPIKGTAQFSALCPSTAIVMVKP